MFRFRAHDRCWFRPDYEGTAISVERPAATSEFRSDPTLRGMATGPPLSLDTLATGSDPTMRGRRHSLLTCICFLRHGSDPTVRGRRLDGTAGFVYLVKEVPTRP
jgi:hypothetical protein